ncbi:hypothetical protein [Streptomyces sp. B6B3]|uniref:hypothetical protein n=1 Tax=Streptomyces sp. B6B3 TaxID=3153570 RepID=UPI00325F7FBD
MRVRTALTAFALATAGLIGSVGTATAQPIFDIDYHLLSPVKQTCIINHPAIASAPIHVFSRETNTCENDA